MATTVTPPAEGDKLPPVNQPDPELTRMRQELSRLTGKVDRIVTAPPARQADPAPAGQPMDKKQLTAKFYEDPVMNTAQIAAEIARNTMASSGMASFDTLVSVARSQARQGREELFDRFSAEIEALVMNVTNDQPQMRQNINVWVNGFNQVKGMHANELIAEARNAPKEPGNQSAAVHTGGEGGPALPSRSAPGGKAEKLSDDQLMVAKGLGLSTEQYLKGKALYDSQDHDPKNKSSWDEGITFDSQKQRRAQREQRNKKSAA